MKVSQLNRIEFVFDLLWNLGEFLIKLSDLVNFFLQTDGTGWVQA